MLTHVVQALRSLIQRPFYVAAAIVILTLGVGTTTSMLAITDALLWQALPYAGAADLVDVYEINAAEGVEEMAIAYPTYRRLAAADVFEEIGIVHSPQVLVWDAPEGPRRVTASLTSPSFFNMVGAQVAEGRLFTADEDTTPGGHPVAILSDEFRREAFGPGAPVLGDVMVVDGIAVTVVGVLPPGYPDYPNPAQATDVWLPVAMVATTRGPIALEEPRYRIYRAMARVGATVDTSQLTAELDRIAALLAEDYPETNAGWSLTHRPVRELFLGDYIRPVIALLVGAVLLLLTGWANLGNLVLLRINERRRELSIRRALGGSMRGLVRLVLTETFLLAVLGGIPGTLLAVWLQRILPGLLPVDMPAFVNFAPSARVYAGALAATAATGFVLAGAVLVNLRRFAATEAVLATGGKGEAVDRQGSRVMNGLIVAEIAAAVVLLAGAALVVRGTASLAGIDLGFSTDDLWALSLQLPQDERTAAEVGALTREVRVAVGAIPGVERADIWSPHIPGAATWYTKARSLAQAATPEDQLPLVRINTVSPGAVGGVGLRLAAGRDFSEDDMTSGRRVMLVSESYARVTWPGDEAVGQQLRRWSHTEWSTVVGVVADAPLSGRAQSDSDSYLDVYFLLGQDPQRDWALLVRAPDDDPAMLAAIREAVARVAPDMPMFDGQRMRELTGREQLLPRFAATLGAFYAATAGLLAAIGLYAVIAYSVTLQRPAIGLRMALGAQRGAVGREFTRRGMRLAATGLIIGLGLAAVTTRLLTAQLYGVSPVDLPTFALVAGAVALSAWLSCLVPARRATRVDPLVALRS